LKKRTSHGIEAIVPRALRRTFPTETLISNAFGVILALVVVGFFGWLLTSKDYTPVERKRFWVILVLFLAAALFWSAFEQAGSTLNLFAERESPLGSDIGRANRPSSNPAHRVRDPKPG